MHRHGHYHRYARASGRERIAIGRFICPGCRLSISVLPADRVPYRPLQVGRLERFFNEQAEAGSGPDPPPDPLEAGCLRRAWGRFRARTGALRAFFGQVIPAVIGSAEDLWRQMRLAKASLDGILKFLARTHKTSLLGDYRCLRCPEPDPD